MLLDLHYVTLQYDVKEDRMPDDEGRMPHREEKVEPRVYYMGDHDKVPGEVPSRQDEEIKRDVDTALFYDEAVSSLGINVYVQNGMVMLDGSVRPDPSCRA